MQKYLKMIKINSKNLLNLVRENTDFRKLKDDKRDYILLS